ncbi:AaceriAFR738Cp [[Ashbya] aceris (nom. inval.)]|nr:AaceriAFR738Cp [[Ashbya] aceris (nom. inval.)]
MAKQGRMKNFDHGAGYQSFDQTMHGRLHTPLEGMKPNKNFYDDFTSVDWVQDYLRNIRYKQRLRGIPGLKGYILRVSDGVQDWVLIVAVALVSSAIAYAIDVSEQLLVDLKRGYCEGNVVYNEQQCCAAYGCEDWRLWSEVFSGNETTRLRGDFVIYIVLSLLLALLAALITLTTRNETPAASRTSETAPRAIYCAYGSGVPEVKTILSGFTIRRFLGSYTLLTKSTALVFAIASGLSLGKEGPYVHLATCVGNICSRMFKKFKNDGIERRVILSASAAVGVTLAFGSPLGGVLFSFEEVSYYLPGNQLFKTFFAAITSHLFLIILNPYGTGKAVLFEVSYKSNWQYLEIILYVLIGVAGGVYGALFGKFVNFWADWFRKKHHMKAYPINEVLLVSLITALITFFNPYTNIAVPELLANIAAPCYSKDDFTGDHGLCPKDISIFPKELYPLLYALGVKIVLTSLTFGIKVPAGIYVPSMVIGALFGRIFAMYFQYYAYHHQQYFIFNRICPSLSEDGVCVDLGIYAMISAGAFMAGVTRMNITLVTIMFELTSSYNYVVPISIAVAVSLFVANVIEPKALYEMLILKNDFPYLNKSKSHDFSDCELGLPELIARLDITSTSHLARIDVSKDNYVSTELLRSTANFVRSGDLIDGSIPVIRNGKLISMLPLPELELALDELGTFTSSAHIIRDIQIKIADIEDRTFRFADDDSVNVSPGTLAAEYDEDRSASEMPLLVRQDEIIDTLNALCDLRPIIDTTPIMLDIRSPLSLVEYVFTRLGNRTIAIIDNGVLVGVLHKKHFIDKCRNRKLL